MANEPEGSASSAPSRGTPEDPASASEARAVRDITGIIKSRFDSLPTQMQVAARYLVDNPDDVALLSMREQSRRAGVPAATMTRLAKALGFSGFDALRAIYANEVRRSVNPFSRRAEGVARQDATGSTDVGGSILEALSGNVEALGEADRHEALLAAAALLSGARRVYCLGQRGAYPVAYHFAYLYGFFNPKPVLLDSPGGIGSDPLAFSSPEDALFVVSMEPAARRSVEVARFARERNLKIVAITTSEASPVGRLADVNILVDVAAPAFFDAMTSSFAACEILTAMIARLEGPGVPAAVRLQEEHRRLLSDWWSDDPVRPR